METEPNPPANEPAEQETLLRDVSVFSRELLEKMKLPLFDASVDAGKLPESEKEENVNALIWLHHVDTDEDEAEAAVEAGEWKAAAKKFKRNPRMLWALGEVEPLLLRARDMMKRGSLTELFAEDETSADGDSPAE